MPGPAAKRRALVADGVSTLQKHHEATNKVKKDASRSLGADIGSEKWMLAKRRADAAKEYAANNAKYKNMARELKVERQRSSEGVLEADKMTSNLGSEHTKYSSHFVSQKAKGQEVKDRQSNFMM